MIEDARRPSAWSPLIRGAGGFILDIFGCFFSIYLSPISRFQGCVSLVRLCPMQSYCVICVWFQFNCIEFDQMISDKLIILLWCGPCSFSKNCFTSCDFLNFAHPIVVRLQYVFLVWPNAIHFAYILHYADFNLRWVVLVQTLYKNARNCLRCEFTGWFYIDLCEISMHVFFHSE